MISMLIYSCKQDEIELLQEISKDVLAFQSEEHLDIVSFHTPEAVILENFENIDVAYIDITDEYGLQIAKKLRAEFPNVEIMIISDQTISPLVYMTPNVRAASLLLKPLEYGMIKNGIRELFDSWEPQKNAKEEVFSFEDEDGYRRIPYSQILYVEARNRRVYIRIKSKEYGIYGSLDALERVLPEQFKRCHRSYIVNISSIAKVWYSKNSILLKNEEQIPLSRSCKAVMREVMKNDI
ncbi:MAG: DNA-binding response regulator [Lachnospiraceae bacterium]|nr:DNA-binding response regulator [Lachnospiraceae bacterium]